MNRGARQTARIGAKQALTDALESNAEGTLRKIESNKKTQEAIKMFFGEDEAHRYARAASYRLEKLANARYAAGGAPRAEGNAVGFMTTSAVSAAKHLALKGIEKAAKGMSEEEAKALTVLGTSPARALGGRTDPIRRRAGRVARRMTAEGIANIAGMDK